MEEEAAPAKKEKTHFTVKLTELNAAEKVKLIKEVKNCIQGLNLVQVRLIDISSHSESDESTSNPKETMSISQQVDRKWEALLHSVNMRLQCRIFLIVRTTKNAHLHI